MWQIRQKYLLVVEALYLWGLPDDIMTARNQSVKTSSCSDNSAARRMPFACLQNADLSESPSCFVPIRLAHPQLWDFRESNQSARSIATITASSTGGYIADILPVARHSNSQRQQHQEQEQQQEQRQQASTTPNRLLVAWYDDSMVIS